MNELFHTSLLEISLIYVGILSLTLTLLVLVLLLLLVCILMAWEKLINNDEQSQVVCRCEEENSRKDPMILEDVGRRRITHEVFMFQLQKRAIVQICLLLMLCVLEVTSIYAYTHTYPYQHMVDSFASHPTEKTWDWNISIQIMYWVSMISLLSTVLELIEFATSNLREHFCGPRPRSTARDLGPHQP